MFAISAVSRIIGTSAYGESVKSEFYKIKNQINTSYGQSKDFDYLKDGSIWDKPQDWMTALYKKDRVLESLWLLECGSILHDDISSIDLSTSAMDFKGLLGMNDLVGIIGLEYKFINYDKALAEIEDEESSVF